MTSTVPLPKQCTVYTHLIDDTTKTVVECGFQSGDVKAMRAGQSFLPFSGLKLNKLGPIKQELNIKNASMLDHNFRIQFIVGSQILLTGPFQIVSSCSRVPEHLRDLVRPTKKTDAKHKVYKKSLSSPYSTIASTITTPPSLRGFRGMGGGSKKKEAVYDDDEEDEDEEEELDDEDEDSPRIHSPKTRSPIAFQSTIKTRSHDSKRKCSNLQLILNNS